MNHLAQNHDSSLPILGTLASCENVVDRRESHNHLVGSVAPDLAAKALELALSKIDAEGKDFLIETVDCGETQLFTQCVQTTAEDTIVYAHRKNRAGPTRFVLNREVEPTQYITAILRRIRRRPGMMVLISAKGGHQAEPEPWDASLETEEEKAASEAYWATHALVWGCEVIDANKAIWKEE